MATRSPARKSNLSGKTPGHCTRRRQAAGAGAHRTRWRRHPRRLGIDAETAFHAGFNEAGGEIVGAIRFPVVNPDFSAFVQRAKDVNPDGVYIWIPGGAQPAAIGKSLAERGVDTSKVKI